MSRTRPVTGRGTARAMRGLSLIELMVAVVLGLLVVLAAIGIFISNRATYQTTDAMGRIQEGARTAFELMARDLREADGTLCRALQSKSADSAQSNGLPMMNLLTSTEWWADWGDGLRGYDNGALKGSVAGTDAIEFHSATTDGQGVLGATHDGIQKLTMEDKPLQLSYGSGDPVLLCDGRQATLFIIELLPKTSTGNGPAFHEFKPAVAGNCGSGLGVGPVCGASQYGYRGETLWPDGTPDVGYGVANAKMAPMQAVRWYVGKSAAGSGNALYRKTHNENAEIIDGVRDLQFSYLLPGGTGYVTAAQVGTRWKQVRAVQVMLELEGGAGESFRRRTVHVVGLRNRNP